MNIEDKINQCVVEIAHYLTDNGATISVAESCTGGMIAQYLTHVPGSSAWFSYGFITYSNQAKQDLVGVSTESLESYGAVSEAVVKEMALGALQKSKADYAISVSGIAGPSGEVQGKPVGTVCIGLAINASKVASNKVRNESVNEHSAFSRTYHFSGSRHEVRQQACLQALMDIRHTMHVD